MRCVFVSLRPRSMGLFVCGIMNVDLTMIVAGRAARLCAHALVHGPARKHGRGGEPLHGNRQHDQPD